MGNSSSNQNKQTKTDDFFAPKKTIIDASTEVNEIKTNIKNVLDFHTKLYDVFKKLDEILNSFEHNISDQSSIHTKLYSRIYPDKKTIPSKDTYHIEYLFNLGVLKTEIKNNETLKCVKHKNFETIHSQFTKNLKQLSSIDPITSTFSLDTVSDQTIKEHFNKNLKTLNNVMARIIFYKYCIVFNNYLNHIYAIYAYNQMEIFESNIKKQQKQKEFVIIQKALDEMLQKTNTNYNIKLSNSLTALTKTIANSTRSTSSGGANSKPLSTPQNAHIIGNIRNVDVLLKKCFNEFEVSNQKTAEFFDKINNIIKVKTEETISKYKDNSQLLNNNIINSLTELEKKIQDNTITPSSSNIETLLSNITTDEEQKKKLTEYLQIVSIRTNAQNLNVTLQSPSQVITTSLQPQVNSQPQQVNSQQQVNSPPQQVRQQPQVIPQQPQVIPQQPQVRPQPQVINSSKKNY